MFTKLGLDVSQAKSVCVASQQAVAVSTTQRCSSKAIKPVRTAKLLGVGHAAKRRRSVAVQKARINTLAKRTPRIQALRCQGVSAVHYIQSAGNPTIAYGVETTGFADTTLKRAVSIAANAIAPPARGKKPRLTLHATAPMSTAVDPSYAVNASPIKAWASAWWDSWP